MVNFFFFHCLSEFDFICYDEKFMPSISQLITDNIFRVKILSVEICSVILIELISNEYFFQNCLRNMGGGGSEVPRGKFTTYNKIVSLKKYICM